MILFNDCVYSLAYNTEHIRAHYIKLSDLRNFDLERVNQGIAPVGGQYTFVHVALKISEPFIVQIALQFVLCCKIQPHVTEQTRVNKGQIVCNKRAFYFLASLLLSSIQT